MRRPREAVVTVSTKDLTVSGALPPPVWRRGWRDHPLRRRVDVAEAWALVVVRAGLGSLTLAGGLFAGWSVYAHESGVTDALEASRRHVDAEVIADTGTGTALTEENGRPTRVWTPVRWTTPDGGRAEGSALVPVGTDRGERTAVWLDEHGRITAPPPSRMDAWVGAVTVAATAAAVGAGATLAAGAAVKGAAQRRRMAQWDEEWRRTGPGGTYPAL
ncbi:hypothetical protein [Streptomyces sp. NPDC047928]|uniref:Rv1733c family protein n=1 Tax=unclassified Streptomyces TaxID=2593676 RepID=UPI003718B94F